MLYRSIMDCGRGRGESCEEAMVTVLGWNFSDLQVPLVKRDGGRLISKYNQEDVEAVRVILLDQLRTRIMKVSGWLTWPFKRTHQLEHRMLSFPLEEV